MASRPWMDELRRAASETEVVALARSYLDVVTPAEMRALGVPSVPEGIRNRDDLNTFAFNLAIAACRSWESEQLQTLVPFFNLAAERAFQFRTEDPGASSLQEWMARGGVFDEVDSEATAGAA